MNSYFMEKTALKSILYGNYVHFYGNLLSLLWKFVVLYGNFVSLLWTFIVTYGNFVSQGLVQKGVIFRPFGVGRGRLGSWTVTS